eukprot:357527-Chlamydomonas_euryale.AAC.3
MFHWTETGMQCAHIVQCLAKNRGERVTMLRMATLSHHSGLIWAEARGLSASSLLYQLQGIVDLSQQLDSQGQTAFPTQLYTHMWPPIKQVFHHSVPQATTSKQKQNPKDLSRTQGQERKRMCCQESDYCHSSSLRKQKTDLIIQQHKPQQQQRMQGA